jgi:hypothetical protein
LLWGGASAGAVQQTERFTLPAERAAIYNLVGEVQLQAGSGNTTVVELVRGGRDAARLSVEQGPMGGYETLRVVYPSDEIVYPRMSRGSSSSFQTRDDGTFGVHWGNGRRGRRGPDWGNQIRVQGAGSGLEAYADLRVLVPEGAVLAVNIGVGKVMLSNVNGRIAIDAASAPVTAQNAKGWLTVDVGSGSVTVTNAEAELSIDTGSGDVEVTGVRGKQLSIDTGSGQIAASDLTVERASVETGSGRLTLSRIRGSDLHFETGSGSIDAELVTDVANLDVETGSGDVVLRVPDTIGATLEIETGSGDIQADFPLAVQRWAKDHVTGRIGDGQGRLDVETGSGDVRIVRLGGGP